MEVLSKHKFLAGVLAALIVLAGLWLWAKGPSAFADGESGHAAQKAGARLNLLPEARQFHKQLQRADSLDVAVKLKELLAGVKKQERALRFRVAAANRDLHLDEFFEKDADAARFYGDDWQALTATKSENTEALLAMNKALEEVAAGDGGKFTPEAAHQIINAIRGRLAMMRERIADSHAVLTLIMRLAANARRGKADARAPAGLPPRPGDAAFLVSHEAEQSGVAPQEQIPAWRRDTNRLLSKYRTR
jgi:hypothetical protein